METSFSSLIQAENLTKVDLYQKYLEFYERNDNVEYISERIAKGRIRRFYNEMHPKAINTSIHLINEKTIRRSQFLILNTLRPFTCLSWSSPLMLNILQSSKHIFVDGTFLSAPAPFTQLFTIAAWNEETQHYYLCNYTLLQGKKAENYEFFFHNLKFIIPGLNPVLITSDFEAGITLAINEYFKKTKILHCKFHFVQCLVRKIDSLKIEKSEKCTQFKKDLKRLAKTKIKYFISNWEKIIDKYQSYEKFRSVLIYFYKNFLLKYPIENWNYSVLKKYTKRTNGYLEKNNRKLNEKFDHRKPGLNGLIYVLKQEEERQTKLYQARMFNETSKYKNNPYNTKDLEILIEKEKPKWQKIVERLRNKNYFPVQNEKANNYQKIIQNYDVDDLMVSRKKFHNRPIKNKKKLEKDNLNIEISSSKKNNTKTKKKSISKKKINKQNSPNELISLPKIKENNKIKKSKTDKKKSKCQAMTKSNLQCKNSSKENSIYCYIHRNYKKN
ncbi:hypothetical protein M0813_16873 [Anaeramoeba flamelloides]|uniref:MULE transposase domain-containing protein n=1 Tax=Anaeramoeba flamelloides TaxID=1746091 RepID=A0ABQ8YXS6_9EUKA|nr:hypothetical protein M0813_16873 [Anaeramoeba flamelloides]